MTCARTTPANAVTTNGCGTTGCRVAEVTPITDPQRRIAAIRRLHDLSEEILTAIPRMRKSAEEMKELAQRLLRAEVTAQASRKYLDEHNGIPPGFPDPWED